MTGNDLNNQSINNGDVVMIVENVGEDLNVVSKQKNNTILEGIAAVFGEMNNNKRIYEKEEYLPHLEYLNEKIKTKQLVGDLDHPPHFEVQLKTASHLIEALDFDGENKVRIKLRILENTPNGRIAKALIDGGVNLSVSSRAAGQVLNEGKVRLQRIFTYDLVAEPGFTEAILKKEVNESLQTNFQMITENFNYLKEHSYIKTNNLKDISESLNFAENYKIYKLDDINKNNEGLNIFTDQKNNENMGSDNVTREEMNTYSEVVKETFSKMNEQIEKLSKQLAESNSSEVVAEGATEVNESSNELGNPGLVNYVNYLAEELEKAVSYSNYLAEMVNKNIKYTEHVAETTNSSIDHSNYLAEEVKKSVNYSQYLGTKLNESINYMEYVKENVNKSISYQNYLAEELDKGIQYTEYVAEKANNGIEYTEYVAEQSQLNREFSDYLSESLSKGIGYSEYIAEQLNSGKISTGEKGMLDGVEKLDESNQIEAITESVKHVIESVKDKSSTAVLENKYPFLKVLSKDNKDNFYNLDGETKQAIVEALNGSVWFNEGDVVSIMEAVAQHKNANIPNYIKFIPNEYKGTLEIMNESEKNKVHAKAQLYTLNTPYQVKAFWDEMDLRGINERVEIEKENRKIEKLNESSQSTEGLIPTDRVVEMQRGYSQSYLDSLKRGAEYRH